MKIHLALAAIVAQAASGTSAAVFPANGQHVTYTVHDTLPRGRSYDETIALTGASTQSVVVSVSGKGRANIAMDNGSPAHLDRALGPGFHLLEITNEIAQAGLTGRPSVSVHLGPPGTGPATLAVRSSGSTITATGKVAMPPPPPMPERPGAPPHDDAQPAHELNVTIVATLQNGKLASARGQFAPTDHRGPGHTWTVSRNP